MNAEISLNTEMHSGTKLERDATVWEADKKCQSSYTKNYWIIYK